MSDGRVRSDEESLVEDSALIETGLAELAALGYAPDLPKTAVDPWYVPPADK